MRGTLRREKVLVNTELVAFADRVRILTAKALIDITIGKKERAIEKIDTLCTEAAKIVNQSQMAQEVSEQNYDLGALQVELNNTEPED
jgi:hypothetical protein